MISQEQRVVVLCPASVVTGGTELLHQLVSELNQIGRKAYISYYPVNENNQTPIAFSCYRTEIAEFIDDADTCFVIPEIKTPFLDNIRKGKVYIWWMSVDNYFGRQRENIFKDIYYRFRSFLNGRKPVFLLKKYTHLAQSVYAKDFLKKHGIDALMLTDYLASEHLINNPNHSIRENLIVYNPKKGIKKTEKLIRELPRHKFVPIQNMGKADVANLLSRAKIYIDFGHHPGKDRMPREAAVAGCCVITGRVGSAKNGEDIPIDGKYKFNDRFGVDAKRFGGLVDSIFNDFDVHSSKFDLYRESIKSEYAGFKKQVEAIFLQV